MQGRPTDYFLSEHAHVCENFRKSRTCERARPGSARFGQFRPVSDGKSVRAWVSQSLQQEGPPGQGPGSEASPFRENTDTQFGKLQQSPVRSLFPPTVNGALPSRR